MGLRSKDVPKQSRRSQFASTQLKYRNEIRPLRVRAPLRDPIRVAGLGLTLGGAISSLDDLTTKRPTGVKYRAERLYCVHEDGEQEENADGLHARSLRISIFLGVLP